MNGQTIDLQRFEVAHRQYIDTALRELSRGRKTSHWMWWIFPQIVGLGQSHISYEYAIRSLEEAKAFLEHPVLGGNLRSCCRTLLALPQNDVTAIFGSPDDLKLRSCMTLFSQAAPEDPLFPQVLDKFYGGNRDERTIEILVSLQR